jgi:hypothetical protein
VLAFPIEQVWAVLRDFNGHDQWHPAVRSSQIERGRDADCIGVVRAFALNDGSELREQLLTLSDAETTYSYCLLDTPIPLFNYVSHVRLLPVTDGDMTFWQWEGRFDTPADQHSELVKLVSSDIYDAGFNAIQAHLEQEA